MRRARQVMAAALGALVFFGAYGCSPVARAPASNGTEVRLEEVKGGVIAGIVSNAWGADIDAVTLPTNPPTTVLLRDSDSPGLRCHEARHREQIITLGQFEFLRRYLAETVRAGYWLNSFEIEARAAQEVCNAGTQP